MDIIYLLPTRHLANGPKNTKGYAITTLYSYSHTYDKFMVDENTSKLSEVLIS